VFFLTFLNLEVMEELLLQELKGSSRHAPLLQEDALISTLLLTQQRDHDLSQTSNATLRKDMKPVYALAPSNSPKLRTNADISRILQEFAVTAKDTEMGLQRG
jgi:hypothetical protein